VVPLPVPEVVGVFERLTGIDIPKAVRSVTLDSPTAPADTAFGTLVAPRIVAPFHSHHFNFRLDVDVDGRTNTFVLGRLKTVDLTGSPRKSVWVLDEDTLAREKDARLDDPEDVWRVVNPARRNARGYNTGYLLVGSRGAAGQWVMKRVQPKRVPVSPPESSVIDRRQQPEASCPSKAESRAAPPVLFVLPAATRTPPVKLGE
jgi:Cu2+-containing amine oxidase